MSFEVTLQIDPRSVADEDTVGIVGIRLVKMGGRFVAWKPNVDRRPAVARFEFSSPDERDQFLAGAIEIPGVSIITAPLS